ncbi:unnamed protein product [Clavelina lepadiformis]|uniref:Uncharacterized protein n=1 Tax=Clavelina lepadiformis TaxID=159417 RepID=A0ABP0FRD0_CLALP
MNTSKTHISSQCDHKCKCKVKSQLLCSRNQKDNQDGTKLPEQRFLPETSPALNVEEENHAPKLNQISRKR